MQPQAIGTYMARSREFHIGDQVLILLPTSINKLLAEWQGPYPITRRIAEVNYEVRMADHRKQKRIFHINMLHGWHAPTAISCWADETIGHADEEDGPISCIDSYSDSEPTFGASLSPAHRPTFTLNYILYSSQHQSWSYNHRRSSNNHGTSQAGAFAAVPNSSRLPRRGTRGIETDGKGEHH